MLTTPPHCIIYNASWAANQRPTMTQQAQEITETFCLFACFLRRESNLCESKRAPASWMMTAVYCYFNDIIIGYTCTAHTLSKQTAQQEDWSITLNCLYPVCLLKPVCLRACIWSALKLMDWNPSGEGSERMALWQSSRPSQMLFLKDRSSLNMSKKKKKIKDVRIWQPHIWCWNYWLVQGAAKGWD